MKRLLCLLLILLALTVSASADILWEPYENAYYNTAGYENFEYMNRTYVVPEGMTATIYDSPKTGGERKVLEAGSRIYIGPYAEIDGELWGAGYPYGDWETEGWVRLARLQLEYDHDAFLQDHGDQVQGGEFTAARAEELNGTVPTWTYPGSGILDRELVFDGTDYGYNDGLLTYIQLYTDPEGGQWGYVGYYMGSCGWLYLDDLYAEDPSFRLIPEIESTVTDTSPEHAPGSGNLLWITIPILLLCAGTAVLILRLKRKQSVQ